MDWLCLKVETDPQEQLALAQSLNDAAARQQTTARQERDRPPAQAAQEPEPYEAEWGERADVHGFNAADFDVVGNTSWGQHGALPLMRAVGRVLNELHRPVEVYKEASRALLNLMAANAEADGTIEQGEAEFTNYHDYLDEGLEGEPSESPKLERIFSPKEERAPTSKTLVALASPGSGSVVLAAVEPAYGIEVMRARERQEIQELADSAEEMLKGGDQEGAREEIQDLKDAANTMLQDVSEATGDDIHGTDAGGGGLAAEEPEAPDLSFELNGWWHGEVYYTSGNVQTSRTFCLRPKAARAPVLALDGDEIIDERPITPARAETLAANSPQRREPAAGSWRAALVRGSLAHESEEDEAEDGLPEGEEEVELEGEGWDDTGPFRLSGGLRFDGVSGERYWLVVHVHNRTPLQLTFLEPS